jgi:hypothetical protein
MEFARIDRVCAKKPHRCDDCRATVQPGETYLSGAGKVEGEFVSWKSCIACDELRKEMANDTDWSWDEMPPLGQIGEMLFEAYGDDLTDAALAFKARRCFGDR